MKLVLFKKRSIWNATLKALYLQKKGREGYLYRYNSQEKEYQKVTPNPSGTFLGKPQDFVSLVDRGASFPDEYGIPEHFQQVFDMPIDHLRVDKTLIQMVEEYPALQNFMNIIRPAFGVDVKIIMKEDGSETTMVV